MTVESVVGQGTTMTISLPSAAVHDNGEEEVTTRDPHDVAVRPFAHTANEKTHDTSSATGTQ